MSMRTPLFRAIPCVVLILAVILLSTPSPAVASDEEVCTDDDASLLQVGSASIVHDRLEPVKVHSAQAKVQACNDSIAVPGSVKRMPARGFITCCNASIKPATMAKSLQSYLNAGGRLIDTAPGYWMFGGEQVVGQVVRASRIPREELWLSSKIDTDGWRAIVGSPKEWALNQIDNTLKIMNVSYLDSMTLHFGPSQVNMQVPQPTSPSAMGPKDFVDMWRALIIAKEKGKVRNIGVCETSQLEIENLISETGEAPAIVVTWHNPWTPEPQKKYVSWAQSKGMAVVLYGLFNFKKLPDLGKAIMPVVETVAQKHSTTYGQVAVKWALDQGLGFVTGLYHPQTNYLQEDLQCQDFHLDAKDHELIASAPSWPCIEVSLAGRQIMPGCASGWVDPVEQLPNLPAFFSSFFVKSSAIGISLPLPGALLAAIFVCVI